MVPETFQSQQIDIQKPFKLIDQVRNTIRTKHYSYKTEKSYVHRIKEYIYFHKKRHPIEMSEREVEEYLSWLATVRHVSSSSQNQAFYALLFLYRYVLEKPLRESINAVRAKRPKRLPIVLSKKEVASVLRVSHGITRLFVLLLYGCGLRLKELLDLRIKDIDFDNFCIIVRDGKGAKDRSVMLPKNSISFIKQQLEYAQSLYLEDRLRNAPGVAVPDALDRKYPGLGEQWAWFWLFPAGNNSTDPLSGIVFSNRISEKKLIENYRPDKTETGFSLSALTINSYKSFLGESGISTYNYNEYLKWLRFYHHFCRKYKYQIESENSLQPFLEKLEKKNNSNANSIMAKNAVGLFLNMLQYITVSG